MSVDETNALRARIGIAPLRTGGDNGSGAKPKPGSSRSTAIYAHGVAAAAVSSSTPSSAAAGEEAVEIRARLDLSPLRGVGEGAPAAPLSAVAPREDQSRGRQG